MNHDIVKGVLEGLLCSGKVSPKELFTGLHNTFAHGDILTKNGVEFSNEQLEEMFVHLEGLVSIAKKMY